MGTGPGRRKKGAHCKNKNYKRAHATKSRRRDVDQIQDDLKKEASAGHTLSFPIDEDLPGLGQYYCTPCARHFIDEFTKNAHVKSKLHKRRIKDVSQEQYTLEEAERGAGKTKEKYTPAHPTTTMLAS